MTTLGFDELVVSVFDALSLSGYSASLISNPHSQPAKILVGGTYSSSFQVWVYIKNLTPAVRKNPDEYRIQLSSKWLPLKSNPFGPTVLLGYFSQDRLFVGFDPLTISGGAKTQLSGGYVSLRVVKRAKIRGMTFDRDRRDRIAVGIRPDMFAAYCLSAFDIHSSADDQSIIALLNAAASGGIQKGGREAWEPVNISESRRRILRKVNVLTRNAGFRTRVLRAYEQKCAISNTQLGIVEAAHILPVMIIGSNDSVRNGIALMPHFHRAFDTGLIYLTQHLELRTNSIRVQQLKDRSLDLGLPEFEQSLGHFRLPKSKRNWPDKSLIKAANKSRGIHR